MIKAFITGAINRNIRNAKRNIKYTDFKSVKSVFITYDLEDFEKLLEVKAIFEKEGISTFVMGYDAQKESVRLPEHGLILSNKETNLFYFPKKEMVAQFDKIAEKCDLLMNISYNNNLTLSYLISKRKELLKIGISKFEFPMYDVIVDVEKNVEGKFLCEHILFYLRKLKGKA